MKPFQVAPEAAREIDEAAMWYESRQLGLGDDFIAELEDLLLQIRQRPSNTFPRLLDVPRDLGVRRAARLQHADRLFERPAGDRMERVIGRNTLSAAMTNAADFLKETNAILVGEPTGARPNGWQEKGQFTLPNSHLVVSVSTRY
jgi:hypothetical protein